MATLQRSDLATVLGFVEYLATLETDEPYSAELLLRLQDVIPCDAATYADEDTTTHRVHDIAEVGPPDTVDLEPYWIYGPCPPSAYRSRTGDLHTMRVSDILPRCSWHEHPVYREYFRPAGVDCIMDIGLPAKPGRRRSITLFRMVGDRDFSDRDVEVLEMLRSHLYRLEAYSALRRGIASSLPDDVVDTENGDRDPLTRREREVAELVASGKTNAEIATALWIAPSTVKKHLDNIYGKIGVGRRAAVAAAAIGASRR